MRMVKSICKLSVSMFAAASIVALALGQPAPARAQSALSTALQNLLTTLGPGAVLNLGKNLTQSNELKALQILQAMQNNPTAAASLLGALTQIPNVPAQVITFVNAAIAACAPPATPQSCAPAFVQDITQAEAALQTAVKTGLLGNLGL